MEYALHWEPSGLLVTYSGHATCTGIIDAVRRIQNDPRWNDVDYVLHDASRCDGASYWRVNLEELAITDRSAVRTDKKVLIAAIATHPQVLALIKVYLSFRRRTHDVGLFSTLESARAWAHSNSPADSPALP